MSEENKTYELDLVCLNCGNQFIYQIPFGLDFHEGTTGHAHYGSFASYTPVKCASCGSHRIMKRATE